MADREQNNLQNIANENTLKIRRQRILSIIFMIIVFIGALGVGICMFTGNFLYPKVEEFFDYPIWYCVFLFISLGLAVGGIVGCCFTKNIRNTSPTEFVAPLIMFVLGFASMIIFALLRNESRAKDICICIGGTICSIGFFCGTASIIGRSKRFKKVFGRIYDDLIIKGKIDYRNFQNNGGVNQQKIAEVEEFFGVGIPEELREFLLEFDGDGRLMFCANDIIEMTKRLRSFFSFVTNSGIERYCFFGGEGKNYCCFELTADGVFDANKIYFFNESTSKRKAVATNLKDFIVAYYNGEIHLEDIEVWSWK